MCAVPGPSALTVTQHHDRLVAVRTATTPDDRARLRHEAGVLSRFEHPGVVRLVDHDEGPPATLRTVFVGPDTWHDRPPVAAEVAPALSALGATLADLHEAGLAHGRVEPSHVLVDPQGRPVLCGLGDARPFSPSTAAVDMAAFSAMGRALATHAGDDGPIIHELLLALDAGHDDLRGTVRALHRRWLPAARAPRRRPSRGMVVSATGLLAVTVLIGIVVTRPARTPNASPATRVTVDGAHALTVGSGECPELRAATSIGSRLITTAASS